ncbi:hypothetical protein ACOMHN_055442 [Nucella lapillus]
MGQQEPRSAHPCRGSSPSSGMGRNESQQNRTLQNKSLLNGRTKYVSSNDRCLFCSTHTVTENDFVSTLTEDSSSLVTDSDCDFPPMLDRSQLTFSEQTDGGMMSHPALMPRTFAQVVSQDSTRDNAERKNCCEDTECTPARAEHESDGGCSAMSCSDEKYTYNLDIGDLHGKDCRVETRTEQTSDDDSRKNCGDEYVDKSDSRYMLLLEFAFKCGYSESDFEKVISKCGLACEKDVLLQELIQNSLESGSPETPSSDTGSEPDESRMEVSTMPGDAEDDVKEMKKDEQMEDASDNLRHIVIDGSNVAMAHGGSVFSCRGIQLVVDWFRERGHQNITVFVPMWRKEAPSRKSPITDQDLLLKLADEGVVRFTPARRVGGRRVVCYDDRYVLSWAAETKGVVVSNDNYRDLRNEQEEFRTVVDERLLMYLFVNDRNEQEDFRTVVDERLLMYLFVNDRFMPPEDPLGRKGPTLDDFLRKQPISGQTTKTDQCPYGRKCTFGIKCRYSHPERGTTPYKMVSEVLKTRANKRVQERSAARKDSSSGGKSKLTRTLSLASTNQHTSVERSSLPSSRTPHESDTDTARSSESPSSSFGARISDWEKSSLLPLSRMSWESDTDTVSRSTSPGSSSGARTSDYLREHRKKLEKELAMASLADLELINENTALYRLADQRLGTLQNRYLSEQSVPSPTAFPSYPMDSVGAHLHNAFPSQQLRGSWSGEASCGPHYSPSLTPPTRQSPPDRGPQVHRSQVPAGRVSHQRYPEEISHQRYPEKISQQQPYPNQIGENQYPNQISQNQYPSQISQNQYPNQINQNQYLSQINQHQYPNQINPQQYPNQINQQNYSNQINPNQYPNLSHTPAGSPVQTFQSPHHPTVEGRFFPNDSTMPPVSSEGSPRWGGGHTFHNHTFTSLPYSQSPPPPLPPAAAAPLPPPAFNVTSGSGPSAWQVNSPPPVAPLPASPVQPGIRDSVPPVSVTDTRYPLYLQLCDRFAQHVVRAVMTKYPEETNVYNLQVYILRELYNQLL